MANLNLPTVELVSTLRQAPSNGPTNSQDYNDSWTESLADLASLSGFINDTLLPMLNGFSSSIKPINVATPNGIEGRYIFGDTSDSTGLFFDSLTNQPVTVADSLRILNGIVTTVQGTVNNLNIEVTGLQTQLSSTNQNDIAQALQNFASALTSLTNQTLENTQAIQNNVVSFETNGTKNDIQNRLNLVVGTNISITQSGGDITITGAGGGGPTAAGLTTEVQVNVGGVFYADSGFTYDHITHSISVAGNATADIVNAVTGYRVNGVAPSGHVLRGNGSVYVDSALTSADFAAPGADTNVLVNDAGVIYADSGFTFNHLTQAVTIGKSLYVGALDAAFSGFGGGAPAYFGVDQAETVNRFGTVNSGKFNTFGVIHQEDFSGGLIAPNAASFQTWTTNAGVINQVAPVFPSIITGIVASAHHIGVGDLTGTNNGPVGAFISATLETAAHISAATGTVIDIGNSGGGTIDVATSIWIPSIGDPGSTITLARALYIAPQTAGAATTWAVYVDGTTPSYFGGTVNIPQGVDGDNVIRCIRKTDITPTGNFLLLRNAADALNVFAVDVKGNMGANSLTLTNPLDVVVGGTGTNLSATGGPSQVVKQTGVGSVFSVARLAAADLSDTATLGNYLRGNATSFVSSNLLAGDLHYNTTLQSSAYPAVAGDVVLGNTVGAGFTVTLPAAASNTNKRIDVKKISTDGNILTIGRTGGDVIDGQTSQSILTPYTSLTFISDGSNWWMV